MRILKKMGTIGLILLGLALFSSSCKKEPNTKTTNSNNNVNTTCAIPNGTYVNSNDITDHFNISSTTCDINGNNRYIISNYYQYSNGGHGGITTYVDTVLESTLLSAPGFNSVWLYNGFTSGCKDECWLYYTIGHFVVQVKPLVCGDIQRQITFFKQ